MSRTIIQRHSTAIIDALAAKVDALSNLEHEPTKGELREIFVSEVLNSFLTSQFSIGTGIVVNKDGDQSNETDVIIYDNRILPPFIKQKNLGVYPAESVVATIEVKSRLDKKSLLETEEASKKLCEVIFNPDKSIFKFTSRCPFYRPLCGVIGLCQNKVALSKETRGAAWLKENDIKYLNAICFVGKYSWIHLSKGWKFEAHNKETREETKRFIAVFLDNVRNCAEQRFRNIITEKNTDGLSWYIRR